MKRCHYLVFCVLILSLAGCSAIDFAYNNAPAFIANEFDDAFDLDDDQIGALEARLEDFFKWHRNHELAAYRTVIDRVSVDAADGISRAEFLWLNDSLHQAYRRWLARLIDDIGDLALTLTPQQIERLEKYFKDKSAEHEDYLEKSPQQRDIHRAEHHLERLEDWFGRFDESLEARALERLHRLPDLYAPWITYRKARQQALIRVLQQQTDGKQLKQALKQIFIGKSTPYAQTFDPARNAFWQAYAGALVDISHWVGKAQRQKAIARLQSYARTISRLSQQG